MGISWQNFGYHICEVENESGEDNKRVLVYPVSNNRYHIILIQTLFLVENFVTDCKRGQTCIQNTSIIYTQYNKEHSTKYRSSDK